MLALPKPFWDFRLYWASVELKTILEVKIEKSCASALHATGVLPRSISSRSVPDDKFRQRHVRSMSVGRDRGDSRTSLGAGANDDSSTEWQNLRGKGQTSSISSNRMEVAGVRRRGRESSRSDHFRQSSSICGTPRGASTSRRHAPAWGECSESR